MLLRCKCTLDDTVPSTLPFVTPQVTFDADVTACLGSRIEDLKSLTFPIDGVA